MNITIPGYAPRNASVAAQRTPFRTRSPKTPDFPLLARTTDKCEACLANCSYRLLSIAKAIPFAIIPIAQKSDGRRETGPGPHVKQTFSPRRTTSKATSKRAQVQIQDPAGAQPEVSSIIKSSSTKTIRLLLLPMKPAISIFAGSNMRSVPTTSLYSPR
ncbi:unnamed protein product [Chondrus crispus]|uniref:Uncharacterized protein n=1 Tax=Chondrus crispus TaxID=2769 RepID=R7Q269_CHOCR|nr:unnamed protein product [Chondrus crispus]CDF32692.1 unnamed protein product [Chondrus crispus]|eukprot:XP_005712463.1 unnamed protein product [Chondrus crispus]